MTWRVLVEYPLDAGREAMDKAITNAAGKPPGFSGAGMGMRDVGWHIESEIEVARLRKALKAIGLSPVVTELQA